MIKYKVEISNQAKKDLKDVLIYIKDNLHEPNISKNIYKKIIDKINSLEINPKKYQMLNHIVIKNAEVRKITLKNYLIFYKIYEKEKEVQVLRILHNKRNWKELL